MFWRYNVAKEWLEARRGYLTASEVASWFSKSLNPKKETIQKNIERAVFRNLSKFPVDTGSPSSDAARGHCLEPYAIQEFNTAMGFDFTLYDNIFLHEEDGLYGYSPDALSSDKPEEAKSLLEVKCYGPEEHMNAVLGDVDKRKERWQVAVGMRVLPNVDNGYVIWYSPNACVPIRITVYTRLDLKEELAKLDEFEEMYNKTKENMEFAMVNDVEGKTWTSTRCLFTEEEIYNEVSMDW